jgi:hypothetical protein
MNGINIPPANMPTSLSTRCPIAGQLRQAWYRVAQRMLFSDPHLAEHIRMDRQRPEYHEAKQLYVEHLQNCPVCHAGHAENS